MTSPDVRVCFAGDSFVAGTGDATALGWVGRVAAAGLARGIDLTSYNLGVRGATSVQVVRRLAIEARPRLTAAEDPRVVVSFGVNDTLPDVLLSTAESLGALRDAQHRMAPVPLLLVGPPAVDDDAQNLRIRDLDAALEREAALLGVPFVGVFAATAAAEVWRRAVHVGDGFHPDAAGYALLAGLVTGPILDWLAAPPVRRPA
ncbi:GDSL-type esterase/lipase family protein [Amnibacterium kyonggiense]